MEEFCLPKMLRTVVAKRKTRFKTAAGLPSVFYVIQQQLGPSSFVDCTCVDRNLHSSQYSIIFWGNHSIYSLIGMIALCLKYLNIQDSLSWCLDDHLGGGTAAFQSMLQCMFHYLCKEK